MTKITNTFNQGLDRDSSKNKYDNVHYWDAKNMRLVTQEGLSGGAMENLRGTYLRLDTGEDVCGHVVMGDYLVIWTTTNTTGTPNGSSTDRIFKVHIEDDLESLTGSSTLTLNTGWFHDGGAGRLVYSGNLYLCTGNLIKAIGRYENSSIQKVYWVDTYNRLKHLNTVHNADTNNLETLSEDKLEAIGDLDLTQPQVVDIVGGELRAGMIQYTYQLYGKHGAETVFSPLTGLVSLTNSPDTNSTSAGYKGADIDDNTGKAVKCTVSITSTGYTRMRIVAVHYTSLGGEPEIRIIEEREISGAAETVYFTDTGNSVGSYLLEDLRTIGTLLFVPKELETKDNILFPANLTEESFDVTYDARAYRFAGIHATTTEPNYNSITSPKVIRGLSQVYQDDGTYYEITGTSKATTYEPTGSSVAGGWANIPTTADCINRFNDLDNDGDHNYRFMYQADGIVPGGEGPNVSYVFKIKETQIDDYTTTYQDLYTILEGTVSNPSYYGYASPYNVEKYLGYHRDEIYRFGIVFFDGKGRSSFVKWIGDIRMPSISTLSNVDKYNLSGGAGAVSQAGDITINDVGGDAYNVYSIQIDGSDTNTYTFTYDNTLGCPVCDRVFVANVIRNQIASHPIVGADVTLGPNVSGTFTITWDKNLGAYSVNDYGGTYVNYVQSAAYVAGSASSNDHTTAWYDGDKIMGNILYPEFTVSNLPAGTESYQIVRVRREALDRTVMAQGVVGPVTGGIPDLWTVSAGTSDIHTFASPEVAFNRNLTQQSNDRLQEVGEFSDDVVADTYGTDLVLYKYRAITAMTNPQLPETAGGAGSAAGDENDITSKTTIVDGLIVAQDQIEGIVGTTTYYVENSTASENFVKGVAFVFEAGNTSWRSKNTTYNDVGTPTPPAGRKLINYRRNIFATQYGGYTNNNRKQNIYIPASSIQLNSATTVSVFGGDTYIGMFDYQYSSWLDGATSTTTQPEVLYFPVETSINLPLRLDDCYHRVYTSANSEMIHETSGVWFDNIPNEYAQPNNLYRYNTVYSKENDSKIFIQAPFDWTSETDFPVRVRSSNVKTVNELSDSWLIYGANAYKDVDPQWGEITNLTSVNEKLMFFQPKAFGILSVNERALLQTSDISQLSLGTSGVLERFDYAKTGIGASNRRHVILTPNGLYWIDQINKAMYKYTGGPEEVSLMKGMDHYFRTALVNGSTTFLFHDPEFKEVMINDHTDNWTLVYSELTDSFREFVDLFPTYVINYNDKVWGTRNGSNFYKHNDTAANRGQLYGTYYDSSITLLLNPNGSNISSFNNMEWLTEVYTNAGVEADVTFDTIQYWNDYQGSVSTGTTLTSGTNVKRRMRKWRHIIPRVTHEPDGTTPKTRTDARFRDSHLFVKLTYTNDANDRRFIAHDITTSVRSSNM